MLRLLEDGLKRSKKKPFGSTTVEIAQKIFRSDNVTESQRVTVSRALNNLEAEKYTVKARRYDSNDVLWRLNPKLAVILPKLTEPKQRSRSAKARAGR